MYAHNHFDMKIIVDMDAYMCVYVLIRPYIYLFLKCITGHFFMTSTRRAQGVKLMWTHVDGEGVSAPCGRPNRKFEKSRFTC